MPYTPGEQPLIEGLVKLNTNENPYPPSSRVIATVSAAAQEGLQLYPDPGLCCGRRLRTVTVSPPARWDFGGESAIA